MAGIPDPDLLAEHTAAVEAYDRAPKAFRAAGEALDREASRLIQVRDRLTRRGIPIPDA